MIRPAGRHGVCPVARGRVTNTIDGQRVGARQRDCKAGSMVKAFAETRSLQGWWNYFSVAKFQPGRCPGSGGTNWLWRHRASGRKSSACLACRSMAVWSPEAFRQNGVAGGGMVCTPPATPAYPLAPLALAAQLLSTAPSPRTWQERLRRCRRGHALYGNMRSIKDLRFSARRQRANAFHASAPGRRMESILRPGVLVPSSVPARHPQGRETRFDLGACSAANGTGSP
jgi:hypothetical protein